VVIDIMMESPRDSIRPHAAQVARCIASGTGVFPALIAAHGCMKAALLCYVTSPHPIAGITIKYAMFSSSAP
jgi:hypothetical protein